MKGGYTIWIEALEREPGTWDPQDDNTDVAVTFADGSRWIATFFTYSNTRSLVEKNRRTGECGGGRYFWAEDMILVKSISREVIEDTVKSLIESGEFEKAFSRCPDNIHS